MIPRKIKWSDTFWAIRCVWLRYFDVFRKSLFYGVVVTITEPLFYLLSFGYGLGGIVGDINVGGHVVSYRQFIFAGIVGQAVMFNGFFEAAYGAFVRYYYQKIFQAMGTTPITLSEVLWGELLWDASKGLFSAAAILAIGAVTGDFLLIGALIALPLAFVFSFLFASLGLFSAAISKTIDQISYPQHLVVFPMFLFCGVFFPVEELPLALQWAAWGMPLTGVVSLVRTLTLGFPFDYRAPIVIAGWLFVFLILSRRAMFKRLIK